MISSEINDNRHFFHEIAKTYGRKIAYTSVDHITVDNVLKVVNDTLSTFEYNRRIISYLWRYYKGDQPIHYRTKTIRDDIMNKVCENHAYEIVQFKTCQTYGEPILYISKKDDENINKSVELLNEYITNAGKHSKNLTSGEWQSAVGTSFQAVQKKDGSVPFRIVCPSPLNTYIVYSSFTEEKMLSVQILEDENGQEYMLCFSENTQFKIINNEVIEYKLHAFGGIPVEEYPNNAERISDIELVIDLLDAINTYQSNRVDSVEQFVQSFFKFVNCEIDREKFEEMKKIGAIMIKSNNGSENKADAEIITNELNQSESQVAKDDLWENVLSIEAIPNKQENSGGDSQGAVELRNGWSFSKSRATLKDAFVKTCEKNIAKVILNVLRVNDINLGLSEFDFDVQINHSPTDNMIVKSQSLQYLLECGIHPLVAIKTVGLWGDAEQVFLRSLPYLDAKWKTIDKIEEEKAQELLEEFKKKNGADLQ